MRKQAIIYLILSIIGIFILLILSLILKPIKLDIIEIDESYLSKSIQVEARISKIIEKDNGFNILILKDKTGNITSTLNTDSDLKKQINISQERDYLITGKVEEYKNSLQIDIDKIELQK